MLTNVTLRNRTGSVASQLGPFLPFLGAHETCRREFRPRRNCARLSHLPPGHEAIQRSKLVEY
jgi:hypothetical protein